MPVFEDRFQRDGPIGGTNGWIDAAGVLQRVPPATDGIETTYAGQPLYSDHTETGFGFTGGVGWSKGRDTFPRQAWAGSTVHTDGRTYSYEVDHNSTRFAIEPDTGTDYSNGVDVYATGASTVGCHVEWEVGGVRYGRKTTVGSAWRVKLLGSELPTRTPSSEVYIVLLDTATSTEIDRFRFPHTGKLPVENQFWGALGAGGIMLNHMGSTSGLWEVEVETFVRSTDAWGDLYILVAANSLNGAFPEATCGIELNVDVGGFASIRYYTADGLSVNQGSTNINSVEDNSIIWPSPWPVDVPGTRFTFKLRVNPQTGVCKLFINDVDRGGCTIPADQMARIRDLYAQRSARYVGFGNFPFIFERMEGSFVITRFKTHLDPPIAGVHEPGRSAFVAPVY